MPERGFLFCPIWIANLKKLTRVNLLRYHKGFFDPCLRAMVLNVQLPEILKHLEKSGVRFTRGRIEAG